MMVVVRARPEAGPNGNKVWQWRGRQQKFAIPKASPVVSAGRVLCDVCLNPAVKTCLTCGDSYCMTCIRPHYSDPDLERHQLQDLQDQSLCEQHQRQLEFYCRTDQSAICSRCFLKDHNGHDVVEQDAHETQCKVTKTGGVPPPGQIQFPSVQPDSVTLRWSPPEGAPGPHKYMVTRRREQHYFPVTGSEVQVTGLLPGEKYHFTVATLSEDGRQSPCVRGSVHTGED
ncbi:E3 ubiquitin-protein ligase TRIM39-like [Clupea harengus]|uniref:E3 ubiquitin-protein ligase TRIM39-like n=1 Tax=Clupea harengus TaxID=7950 RepID=A0A8M1KD04_CLUHA|nr:E3 ubiquitin-protein ligase TRIM39-like [Clupea harengus]